MARVKSGFVRVITGFSGGRQRKEKGRGGRSLRSTVNSTIPKKRVDSPALVPSSSRKARDLSIEALYVTRTSSPPSLSPDEIPSEGERARLISALTKLLREPQMPETTRVAGLTLIGWLARRMPGEEAHAIGVSEARESERRLRASARKPR